MEQENICKQCGGVKRIEFTIAFEECRPHDMRQDMGVDPSPYPLSLCPGHPATKDQSNWEYLTGLQKYAVDTLRSEIRDILVAQTERFYRQHPELRLTWDFTLDAFIRSGE